MDPERLEGRTLVSSWGKYTLSGPDPANLPMRIAGEYQIILRIEASDDDVTVSDLSDVGAGPGTVNSGAVAGFPMPVLHYFVGAAAAANSVTISQLAPADDKRFVAGEAVDFAWVGVEKASLYRLEITDIKGTSILSALLPTGTGTYRAPSWLWAQAVDGVLRWRVIALDETGRQIGQSSWRIVRLVEVSKK